MTYSEALEQQVALLNWLESHPGETSFTGSGKKIEKLLAVAETYYVGSAILEALMSAADALAGIGGSVLLDAADLPSENGFVWFESALAIPDGEDVFAIRSLAWMSVMIGTGPADPTAKPGIGLMAMIAAPDRPAGVPGFATVWRSDRTLAEALVKNADLGDDSTGVVGGHLLMLFAALALFVQQRILVAHQQPAERHTRKRLEREGWTQEPLVRVVQLRRKERAVNPDAVQPTDREYSCQWIVRGHWRQQWYPKAQRNQPVWITPYVKGPEDKPLKAPRATVFAVVR